MSSSGDRARADGARRRAALARVGKPAIAIALLVVVAMAVPWGDRLVWSSAGSSVAVAGTIEGDWRARRVAFSASEAELPEELPSAVRARLAEPEPVALERGVAPAWAAGGEVYWRPGMVRVFRELDVSWLVPALAALLVAAVIGSTRWWRLLNAADCKTSWPRAVRLTFLGLFFNIVMPGMTGGDLVKAVLAVREHPERRARALVSVFMDRALGLLALLGMAATVILASPERFGELQLGVALALAVGILCLWALLVPAPRRFLGLSRLLRRLPQRERLRRLDDALRLYGRHPVELGLALALSVANHLMTILAVYWLGHAYGAELGYAGFVGVVSVANTVSALPLAPGGWGVGEAAYGTLFELVGSVATLGVAISITYRLCNTAVGLVGGVWLLLPGGKELARAVPPELDARDLEAGELAAPVLAERDAPGA